MMRVLIVVGSNLPEINRSSVCKVLLSFTELRILSPAKSSPITPITHACAPSASRFASTFAAPPRCVDSRLISTTGTGASGEMRVTSPQRNSSSITSPSTTILLSRNWRVISSARGLRIDGIPTKVSPKDRKDRKGYSGPQHALHRRPVPTRRRERIIAFGLIREREMTNAGRRFNYFPQAVHLRSLLRRPASPECRRGWERRVCTQCTSGHCRQVLIQLWRGTQGKPEFRATVH